MTSYSSLLRQAALSTAASLLVLLATGCRYVHAGPDVAFLGDSLTQGWRYPAVNYGIHGNTTAQMLDRFPRLIPGHGYTTVVLLGGTNDVLLGIPPETTIHNLEDIAQQTIRQHAEPILCEIPPIFHSFDGNNHTNFGPNVIDLNRRIAQLAQQHHWKLVDYYTPISGHPAYSSDGVHLKLRGYLVMEKALLPQLPAN